MSSSQILLVDRTPKVSVERSWERGYSNIQVLKLGGLNLKPALLIELGKLLGASATTLLWERLGQPIGSCPHIHCHIVN